MSLTSARSASDLPRIIRSPLVGALTFLLITGISAVARADHCPAFPWQHLGDTGREFVRPLPLVLVGSAALAPAVMAPTGLDHELRLVAQEDLGGSHAIEPFSIYAPYVVGGGVLVGHIVSHAVSACAAQRHTAAVLQAMVFSLGSTVLLKWAVGREWPNAGLDPESPDRLDYPERAEAFEPFRSFGSWPSGHTSFMFATASALRTAAPEIGIVGWVVYPFALGVATGMWIGDHHWASDIVSGGLLGEAIGSSVGRGFAPSAERETVSLGFGPVAGDGALVQVYGIW
jgi:membrane-associated phospholipid phosphatase